MGCSASSSIEITPINTPHAGEADSGACIDPLDSQQYPEVVITPEPQSQPVDAQTLESLSHVLFSAVKVDDIEKLSRLLSTKEGLACIDENNEKENGWTLLHAAVVHSKLNAVKFLLDKGADMEAHSSDGGGTPLSYAALTGQERIAEYLLSVGADKEEAIKQADSDVVENFFVELERISKLRPELEAKRQQLEVLKSSAAAAEKPETLPTTCKGITIGGLKKLKVVIQTECEAGRFKEDKTFPDGTRCKGTTKFKNLTTTDVVYRYVKDESVTGDRRLADCGLLGGDQIYFDSPSLFVSHAWKGRFSVLVDEVLVYAEKHGLSDNYSLWMDMWAV